MEATGDIETKQRRAALFRFFQLQRSRSCGYCGGVGNAPIVYLEKLESPRSAEKDDRDFPDTTAENRREYESISLDYPEFMVDRAYTFENTRPCCYYCTSVRANASPVEFLRRIEHILRHHGLLDQSQPSKTENADEPFPDTYFDYSLCSSLTQPQMKKGLRVAVGTSKANFFKIAKDPCMCCGKENSATHRNGVHVLDPSVPYVPENMRSFCKTCCYMKSRFTFPQFLRRCCDIYFFALVENGDVESQWEEDPIDRALDKLIAYSMIPFSC